ncbi:MAG: hypothetical protein KY462_16325 [Actinobacteria bacterium]|nr:hypothetical protein [Actinomycetota bacterium]
MSRDQQTARVNVSDDEWIEFRTLAMRKRRSIADYLGDLVRRELDGSTEPTDEPCDEKSESARRHSPPRVRLADQELLTGLPRPRPESPAWDE